MVHAKRQTKCVLPHVQMYMHVNNIKIHMHDFPLSYDLHIFSQRPFITTLLNCNNRQVVDREIFRSFSGVSSKNCSQFTPMTEML